MAKKIYVGNLATSTTDDHLLKHFSQAGKVVSAKVSMSMNPKVNAGYGYVVMSNDFETEEAIRTLNNTKLEGKSIRVMEAHRMDQDRGHGYQSYRGGYRKRK